MNQLVQGLREATNETTTTNGMVTNRSSLNAVLDLFFKGGAARKWSESEIQALFASAIKEDPRLAIQTLGYIRDVRGGMGERRFFRSCLRYIARNTININLKQIPEIGRWDDLFAFIGTAYENDAFMVIKEALTEKNGLCAKWMPRKGRVASRLRQFIGMTHKEYRKTLVHLTKVVETQMCAKQWGDINYSHVPSVANKIYSKAFLKHDAERRREFIEKAIKGDVKINASAIFPHDIIKMIIPGGGTNSVSNGSGIGKIIKQNDTALAMWNQLPNYLEGVTRNFMVMADTSGSMSGDPFLISIALAMYMSERTEGAFKDAFLTFDMKPELQYLSGDLYTKLSQIRAYHGNTNLEAAFRLLLETAIQKRVPAEQMPSDIIIVSDMEFDYACRPNWNAMQMIKNNYFAAGYTCPNIIFWNVRSQGRDNVPVRFNDKGVGLVSGASPAVLKALFGGQINPIDILLRAVDVEKYRKLTNY